MRRNFVNKILSQIRRLLRVVIVLSILSPYTIFSQEKSQQKLMQGVNHFWQAEFEDAIEVLKQAIALNTLKSEQLFSAYLYIGFSRVRMNNDPELIDEAFRHAVLANPQLKLDPSKIPPDLLNRFHEIRGSMLGSLYVNSDPVGADISGFSSEEKVKFRGRTPRLFENLLVGTYDVSISKAGYQEKKLSVSLTSSKLDILNIELTPEKKPFFKNWWTWAAGGGLVAGSVIAIISLSESTPEQPESSDLPEPPDRP
ncbi:hypothetical protein GF337_13890 [candidate division KSB1 bacterium]|nr:hypothetical protein [candidate division KSB1 bacterium]